tara:strand:- start:248 stop:397 length:150 start_codon:yes stop_codon:yes gene_type:complete
MKIKGLTEQDCAFVYYVLRNYAQNHEKKYPADEQDVDGVYEIAKKFKNN